MEFGGLVSFFGSFAIGCGEERNLLFHEKIIFLPMEVVVIFGETLFRLGIINFLRTISRLLAYLLFPILNPITLSILFGVGIGIIIGSLIEKYK